DEFLIGFHHFIGDLRRQDVNGVDAVVWMEMVWNSQFRGQSGSPADVIGVYVGIQYSDDLQPLIFDPAEVFIDMAQRIDDDRLTPGSDDVAEAPPGRPDHLLDC